LPLINIIMKKYVFAFALLIIALSCNETHKSDKKDVATEAEPQDEYESFGAKISPEGSFSSSVMLEKYGSLQRGDTINAKFKAKVNSVCEMKGCWMVLDLPGVDDAMVKFLDYGFFVPKDIIGKEVIVRGKAFLEETSVEDQKHYADDARKNEIEIASIEETEKNFGFIADGVLVKK